MSASRTHVLDPRRLRVVWMAVMASIVFLPGRKPYELASKRHSHSGSSASLMVACITRSLTVGMPSGRIASVRFGDPYAPHGLRSVTLQGKAILKELNSGFGRVHNHAVHPRSVFAAVLLGDLTDCQQLCGLRVDEELLKVLHLFVLPVASGSEDPPLQTPYACLDGSPVDVLPCQFASWGRFNDEHCLTSPQVRTFQGICVRGRPAGSLHPLTLGISARAALSAPLQRGIRFLRLPLPPAPSPFLAVRIPRPVVPAWGAWGLPC